MDTSELGTRLRELRERVDMSQVAAADAANINRVLLNYYESGKRDLPLTTAAALARLYGATLEDLVRGKDPVPRELDVSGVLFRATPVELGDPARAGLHLFEQHLSSYLEFVDDLGIELLVPKPSPFPEAVGHARRLAVSAARRLRDFLGVGQGPLDDPFRQVDEHVLVWRLPLGEDLDDSPSGFFYRHPRLGACVVVNTDMTLGRQVFTLAHELAHVFFHSQETDVVVSTRPQRDTGRERFADAFAGELLVPGDALRETVAELEVWEELADPVVIVHLQRHFGVSFATLLVRLRQENLIDGSTYEELGAISPSRLARALGYPVHQADMGRFDLHPLERFPTALLLLVRWALQKGEVTLGDAAETLGCSSEDVRRLLGRPRADNDERSAHEDLKDAARLN